MRLRKIVSTFIGVIDLTLNVYTNKFKEVRNGIFLYSIEKWRIEATVFAVTFTLYMYVNEKEKIPQQKAFFHSVFPSE